MIIDWLPCSTEIKCYILLRICCKCSVVTTSKFPIFKNDNIWYVDNVLLKSLGIRLNQPHITSLKLSLVSYILTPSLSLMLISAPLLTRYFNISRWFPSAAMYTGVHWWSEKQNWNKILQLYSYSQHVSVLDKSIQVFKWYVWTPSSKLWISYGYCICNFEDDWIVSNIIVISPLQLWSMQMIE